MAQESYAGFEQGPIRPPSEAGSLLLRVTRNCPWNRCKFCPVYKGTQFSRRPVDHVLRDIEAVYRAVQTLTGEAGVVGRPEPARRQGTGEARGDLCAWQAAASWVDNGRRSVFLQDADSLVIGGSDLIDILSHLTKRFPGVQRVTSYARSSTVARMESKDLKALRESGLNRLHIGLESGANEVLRLMHKGTTQKNQIVAGLKVKQAGMKLSEYYMPGLGGRGFWEANARETAAALNEINPDFIRLRTLAIHVSAPLYDDYRAGRFDKPNDVEMAREVLLFLESLRGLSSVVKSDHILNLLPEVEGALPEDQGLMISVVEAFLKLSPEEQVVFQVGRRTGMMNGLGDLEDPFRRGRAEEIIRKHEITSANVDAVVDELMRQFV
ncbi:MAG: radical SAM protein [Deltaproteobacteria bacterium]|nr:radical SAM protein [Deltaproteobacteria bacterium]